jgi:hypothetical protein
MTRDNTDTSPVEKSKALQHLQKSGARDRIVRLEAQRDADYADSLALQADQREIRKGNPKLGRRMPKDAWNPFSNTNRVDHQNVVCFTVPASTGETFTLAPATVTEMPSSQTNSLTEAMKRRSGEMLSDTSLVSQFRFAAPSGDGPLIATSSAA